MLKKKCGILKKMGNVKKRGKKHNFFKKSLKNRGKTRNCEQKTQKQYYNF